MALLVAGIAGCGGGQSSGVRTASSGPMIAMRGAFAPVPSAETTSPAEDSGGWVRREWSLQDQADLLGWYEITNAAPEPREFSLVALMDYRQVEVVIAGYRGMSHDVTVPAEARVEQLLRIGPIGRGRHEVVTLLFADPASFSMQGDTSAYDDDGYMAQRMMIQSGQSVTTETLEPVKGVTISANDTGDDDVALLREADGQAVRTMDADPGQAIDVLARLGNASEEEREYAVIGLVDLQQVALSDGATDARVVVVPARSIATVPIRLRAPARKGGHSAIVLRVADPMRLREFEPSEGVAVSQRLEIRVR